MAGEGQLLVACEILSFWPLKRVKRPKIKIDATLEVNKTLWAFELSLEQIPAYDLAATCSTIWQCVVCRHRWTRACTAWLTQSYEQCIRSASTKPWHLHNFSVHGMRSRYFQFIVYMYVQGPTEHTCTRLCDNFKQTRWADTTLHQHSLQSYQNFIENTHFYLVK